MDDPVVEIPAIIHALCRATPAEQRTALETYFTPTASFSHPFCRTGSGPCSRWLITQIYRWHKILSPHVDVSVNSVAFDKKNLLLYISMHQNFKLRIVPFHNSRVEGVTVLQLVKCASRSASTPNKALRFSGLFSLTPETHNGKSNHVKGVAVEKESWTPDKGKKKVVFTSPPDDRARKTPLPTGNPFSVLASPSPSPSPIPEVKEKAPQYYIQSQTDLYQTNEWIKFLTPWGTGGVITLFWQFVVTLLCVVGTQWYDFITGITRKRDVVCGKVPAKKNNGAASKVD